VFEATGLPAVVREAVDVVAPSGTVVIVGLSREAVSIPMVEFTRKELSVLGSRNSHGQFPEATALVREQAALLKTLITHRFPFERSSEAFRLVHEQPATTEKVVILMGDSA
jgi:threonine dehydrogenase-like Zn-dependent dehydrogenase